MRIGIDARILGHPRSGIAVYALNLIEQFSKNKDLGVVLFGDRPIRHEYKEITDKAQTVIFGQEHRKRWSQFYLPAQLKKYKIDIYHATWNGAVPVLTKVPSVLTVHDLIPLALDGYFKNWRRRYKYIFLMRSALWKAKAIIAVSESTKSDLIRYFNVPKEKIKVVHLGIDKEILQVDEQEGKVILKGFGIDKEYIVNIGSFDRRRNADTFIKAFALFVKNTHIDCQIVIIGGYDNFKNEVERLKEVAAGCNLGGKVIFANYVSERQMSILLTNAKMMVHPSLYEGFCLPVLEAMRAGIPVVASNRGSVPQIAGDAAIFIDPADEAGTARAIGSLWQDNNKREEFIKKGAARIKEFSWQKTAEDTINIYREVLGGKIS